MNYDIFLFNGHGEGDNGACYNGYKEQELAKKLVNRVKEILSEYGVNVHTNGDLNNYNRNLTKGNTYTYKEGLCIHLNASAYHNAYGSEIIVPAKLANFTMEKQIVDGLSGLGFVNRGVKTRDYDSEQWIPRTNGSAVNCKDYYREIREAYNNGVYLSILEVCFIDSSDINRFNTYFENIARLIANAFVDKYGLKKPKQYFYRVVTGSFADRANAEKRIADLKKLGYDSFIEKREK